MTASAIFLDAVELCPLLTRLRVEEFLGYRVVGDPLIHAIKFECATETLRQHAQIKDLGEWPGYAERRARSLFALAGEEEVFVVVGIPLRVIR